MRKMLLIAGILTGLTCLACSNNDLPTWDGLGGNHGQGGVSGETDNGRQYGTVGLETTGIDGASIATTSGNR